MLTPIWPPTSVFFYSQKKIRVPSPPPVSLTTGADTRTQKCPKKNFKKKFRKQLRIGRPEACESNPQKLAI